jgi:hypothetical protein
LNDFFQAQISPLAETWHCTAQVCPSGVTEDVGPRAASAVQELAKQCLQTAAEVSRLSQDCQDQPFEVWGLNKEKKTMLNSFLGRFVLDQSRTHHIPMLIIPKKLLQVGLSSEPRLQAELRHLPSIALIQSQKIPGYFWRSS